MRDPEVSLSSVSSLRGRVEYHDGRLIKGWAVDLASPQRPVSLEVVERDRVVVEFEPTIYRQDLDRQEVGAGRIGFAHEVPPSPFRDATTSIHLRFAETGLDLEGSPVAIGSHYESRQVPFETTVLTGDRVLALAPHPDDESLACGGALLLHRDATDPVKVVFLTDGADAARADDGSAPDLAARRRAEALAATRVLGVGDVEFWNYPDRRLADALEATGRLARLLRSYDPGLVYAPSPLEFHPDHRATAEILWAALERTDRETRVAFYDFNRPINVNVLVDISAVMPRKRAACDAYPSQQAIHPYTEAAVSLNRYRALAVSPAVDYAEGFFVISSREFAERPIDSFVLRQFAPLGRAGPEPDPLVSVIVRTKDRPRLLSEALASVMHQDYPNIEVVLVNDGGVEVAETVAELEAHLPIRRKRLESAVGRVAAANVGLGEARGKYLNFLDDDDILYPGHVSKLVRYLETTGERFAYSDTERARYDWTGSGFELRGEKVPFCCVDFDRDRLYESNYIPFMSAVFRRDLTDEVGPFDEELEALEDWDYWLRLSQVTHFVRLPGVTAEYRMFADRDYEAHTARIRRKHGGPRSTWGGSDVTWSRIRGLEGELAARRLGEEAALEQLADGARRAVEREERMAQIERRLEDSERAFRMVTESYSWRLTRKVPSGLRRSLSRLLRWLGSWAGAAEKAVEGPTSNRPAVAVQAPQPAVDPAAGITFRGYRPGDEQAILDLFAACFGHRRPPEEWRWKYCDNPYGRLQISLAVAADGQLLAHHGAYPCRFVDCTAAEPRQITALQIGDTMTLPRARQVGRRRTSLLHRVVEHHLAQYSAGRVGFDYGFNTGKIQRYYLRLVAGSQLFEEAPLKVLGESEFEGLRAAAARRAESYQVSPVDEVDSRWDDLFQRVAPRYRFLAQRDAEYCRWRYLDRPGAGYLVFTVSTADRLAGWSVFERRGDALVWGDALFDPRAAGAAATLLAHALAEPAAAGVTRVEGWFSRNPVWWHQELTELNFESQPEPQNLGMIFLPFEEPDPLERFQADLYYTMGDSDLF